MLHHRNVLLLKKTSSYRIYIPRKALHGLSHTPARSSANCRSRRRPRPRPNTPPRSSTLNAFCHPRLPCAVCPPVRPSESVVAIRGATLRKQTRAMLWQNAPEIAFWTEWGAQVSTQCTRQSRMTEGNNSGRAQRGIRTRLRPSP